MEEIVYNQRKPMEALNNIINSTEQEFLLIVDSMLSDIELKDYKLFLQATHEYVVKSFSLSDKIIKIHPLTDIYGQIHGKLPDNSGNFVLCNDCPCYHCIPNKETFKKYTKNEYIPPIQLCKKSFLELNCAYEILNKYELENHIVSLSIEEHYYNCLRLYGSNLINNNLFKDLTDKYNKTKELIN